VDVHLILRGLLPEWQPMLEGVRNVLGAVHVIRNSERLADHGVNLWVGTDLETLRVDLAAATPVARRRTIVLGIPPGFRLNAIDPPPGSLAEVLEAERLAGAFDPDALVKWQEVPSWFAGPRSLMAAARTNAFKAMQTDHYAIWFAARGHSLAEFLAGYLPLVEQHVNG
jgi:hypothetical protein